MGDNERLSRSNVCLSLNSYVQILGFWIIKNIYQKKKIGNFLKDTWIKQRFDLSAESPSPKVYIRQKTMDPTAARNKCFLSSTQRSFRSIFLYFVTAQ